MGPKRGQSNPSTAVLAPIMDATLSGDVHEFMERPAPWLLRSGSTVLAVLMAVLIGLSLVIKYPDTITARVTITGTLPVAEVVARQSGQLESLRAHQGQTVKKGEILAVIQNPSRSAAVLTLAEKLEQVIPALSNNTLPASAIFKAEEGLGSIQDTYAEFLNAYQKLNDRLSDDYVEKASVLLQEQVTGKEAQIRSLQTQIDTSKRELELAQQKYDRTRRMNKENLISVAELQDQECGLEQAPGCDRGMERGLCSKGSGRRGGGVLRLLE